MVKNRVRRGIYSKLPPRTDTFHSKNFSKNADDPKNILTKFWVNISSRIFGGSKKHEKTTIFKVQIVFLKQSNNKINHPENKLQAVMKQLKIKKRKQKSRKKKVVANISQPFSGTKKQFVFFILLNFICCGAKNRKKKVFIFWESKSPQGFFSNWMWLHFPHKNKCNREHKSSKQTISALLFY